MALFQVRDKDGKVINIPAFMGPMGKSAYEVAKENGFEGAEEEWLESLKGEDYVLTEADKQEIANMFPTPDAPEGNLVTQETFDSTIGDINAILATLSDGGVS